MKSLTATAIVLLLCVTAGIAQDKPAEKTFTLRSYGDKGQVALEEFAKQLACEVEPPQEGEDAGGNLDAPCWFVFKDLSADKAASVLSFAIGLNVTVDHARKKVTARTWPSAANRSVKGYDVSVLATRYVEYINRYGAAKAADAKAAPDLTATEHLRDLLEELLVQDDWGDTGACCVGQRMLLNLNAAQHQKVRELLSLLMSDKGGESEALAAERTLRDALAQAAHEEDYSERPLGSVMGSLFGKGSGFVVAHALAAVFSEQHVTRPKGAQESKADVLNELALRYEFSWGAAGGLVRLTSREYQGKSGYRVFELKELLERLAAAYAGQRTVPGKKGGFEGDIKTLGGMAVIRKALEALADSADRAFSMLSFGTRLVVSGSAENIDAAAAILKEMGFEEPRDE